MGENWSSVTVTSMVLGIAATGIGAVIGHYLDLTTWEAQQAKMATAQVFDSTSIILSRVVVEGAKARDAIPCSHWQSNTLKVCAPDIKSSALFGKASARLGEAEENLNTQAVRLEALLDAYFDTTARVGFDYLYMRRYRPFVQEFRHDSATGDTAHVELDSLSDAVIVFTDLLARKLSVPGSVGARLHERVLATLQSSRHPYRIP